MPSFRPPSQSGPNFGSGFSFNVDGSTNPFSSQSQSHDVTANSTPSFQFASAAQQNGAGTSLGNSGIFGSGGTVKNGISFGNDQSGSQNTFSFGQNQAQPARNSTNIFGGLSTIKENGPQENGSTATPSQSLNFGQSNGGGSFTGFGQSLQQTQSTPSASFSGFGQKVQPNSEQDSGKALARDDGANAPGTGAANIFAGLGNASKSQPQTNGSQPSLFSTFTQAPSASQPSSKLFNFGPTPTASGDDQSASQGPGEGSSGTRLLFSGAQKPMSMPGSAGTSSGSAQVAQPGNSLFGSEKSGSIFPSDQSSGKKIDGPTFSGFGSTQAQTPFSQDKSAGQNDLLGPSRQTNTGDTSSENQQTPKPGTSFFGNGFASSASQQNAQSSIGLNTSTSNAGIALSNRPSLFDNTSSQPPSFLSKSSDNTASPSTNFAANIFSAPPQPAQSEALSTVPKAMATSSASLFSKPSQPSAPSHSLFAPPSSAIPPNTPKAPTIQHQPPTPMASAQPTLNLSAESNPDDVLTTFQALNEGMRAHLQTQDACVDWTPIVQYYLVQAAKIDGRPEPGISQAAKTGGAYQTGTHSASNAAANMFASANPIQDTPRSTASQLFSSNAASNAGAKRLFDHSADDVSAAGKRPRSTEGADYPKLPPSASKTAKLFQATIENSNSSANGFGATTDTAKPIEQEENVLMKRKADGLAPKEGSSGVFVERQEVADTERQSTMEASQNSQKAKDSVTATSGGMGFGRSAELGRDAHFLNKNWFDRIPKEIAPAASPSARHLPGSTFYSTGADPSESTSNSTPNIFGSLFKEKPTDNASHGEAVEKETQGSGDKTKKPETPIKFGFGSSQLASTTPAGNPATTSLFGTMTTKPAMNFNSLLGVPGNSNPFGGKAASSLATSRHTTPGVTTDGEGTGVSTAGDADKDEEAAADEPQVEDQTDLLPSEKETEDVLFTVALSKGSKWGQRKDPTTGELAPGWIDRGKGPLYILRNKTSRKVRILLKVAPYGAAKMNFEVLAKGGYTIMKGTDKVVLGLFVDHLDNESKPGKWIVRVGKKEDAEALVKILRGNHSA